MSLSTSSLILRGGEISESEFCRGRLGGEASLSTGSCLILEPISSLLLHRLFRCLIGDSDFFLGGELSESCLFLLGGDVSESCLFLLGGDVSESCLFLRFGEASESSFVLKGKHD